MQGCCPQPDPSGCSLFDSALTSTESTDPWDPCPPSRRSRRHRFLAGGKRSNRTTEIPHHFGSLSRKCLWPWARKLLSQDLWVWCSSRSPRWYIEEHLAKSEVVGNLDLDVPYLSDSQRAEAISKSVDSSDKAQIISKSPVKIPVAHPLVWNKCCLPHLLMKFHQLSLSSGIFMRLHFHHFQ